VSGDILDLFIYEGGKGLQAIQETGAYKLTDQYVHYQELYKAVKSKGEKVLGDLKNLNQKIILFYDEATNFVGMLVKVIQEKQEDLIKYVKETYSNVQVFVKDNWMRLDFNKDGSVTMEDLRQKIKEFYEFLKNYDYIQTTMEIKSNLYNRAVQLMKKEKDSEAASTAAAETA